jgi:hypothetical protein
VAKSIFNDLFYCEGNQAKGKHTKAATEEQHLPVVNGPIGSTLLSTACLLEKQVIFLFSILNID